MRRAVANRSANMKYSVKCPTGDTSTPDPNTKVAAVVSAAFNALMMPSPESTELPVFADIQKMKPAMATTAVQLKATRQVAGRMGVASGVLVRRLIFFSVHLCATTAMGGACGIAS